eukprot:CAMPEP_0171117088 /NCGR_PEP_ID=MMETSP0766_2-20121228/91692_1 /TAXON_ID=439317 /ORGANISM="Gambierdiscus australes, Strain CAWD 149" /LENGTH=42 /DNA_ID= /DNA_START= /DNA_END= /DNA_ORIENTATION=
MTAHTANGFQANHATEPMGSSRELCSRPQAGEDIIRRYEHVR